MYSQTLLKKVGDAMKNKQINIRVSEKEMDLLKNKSRKCNMNMTEFILATVKNSKIAVINDLTQMQRQLRYIGNNLNQLTKLCHEGIITCLNLSETKKEVGEIWRLLNLLIQKQSSKH